MRKFPLFCAVFVILALQMGLITRARADVVGRLTRVEGRVDILKGGQLPATPAKTNDAVQPGDVLRTKSLSKAQVTFIDNSTMTLAPKSRVAIEAFLFDSAKNKRNAVIELFKGLALMVVNKVYQTNDPDFVVKTQTAIMGVRGTEFGIRLQPNSSEFLNFKGLLQVGNIFPEIGQLPRRAFKVAYSFGSVPGSHWVFVKAMQGTSVARGLPPTLPWSISDEERRHFFNQLEIGLNICRRNSEADDTETGGGPPSEMISGCAPATGLPHSDPLATKPNLLTASIFQPSYTPPYTPPNLPPEDQVALFSASLLGLPGDPENPENPPSDQYRPHRHFTWHRHFPFDRDFFRHRSPDDWFDFWRYSFYRRGHNGREVTFWWNSRDFRDGYQRFDFGFSRNFRSPRGHDPHFGFGSANDLYNPRGHNNHSDFTYAPSFCRPQGLDHRFGFGGNHNFFGPWVFGGQFPSFHIATLRTRHNLTNFQMTRLLRHNFPGAGPEPHIASFIQHTCITNPRVLVSHHGPGNTPGGMIGHPGGPPPGRRM